MKYSEFIKTAELFDSKPNVKRTVADGLSKKDLDPRSRWQRFSEKGLTLPKYFHDGRKLTPADLENLTHPLSGNKSIPEGIFTEGQRQQLREYGKPSLWSWKNIKEIFKSLPEAYKSNFTWQNPINFTNSNESLIRSPFKKKNS